MKFFYSLPQDRRARRPGPSLTPAEFLEVRSLLSASPTGGVGNNQQHPEWGSAGVELLRTSPADYADGVSAPAGEDRPSPRAISNALSDQSGEDIFSDRELSALVYAFGQFIDHDIDLTPTGGTEPLSIPVPTGDPSFDPAGTGTQTINTTRSVFDPDTGTSSSNPRQQINVITAFLDGSVIYGSDAATTAALRTHVGGRLKTSAGGLLPYNNAQTFPNGTLNMVNDAHVVPDDQLFAAGDVRANENIELTSLQTLFVREHNYWAGQISKSNPQLNDEQVFQRARARVVAELQAITYNEWLPTLLGPQALDRYQGYNPKINPGISNEFSTAAFRFGHSLLADDVEFFNNQGLPIGEEIPLSEAFFNPALLKDHSIDSLLKYMASDLSSEVDTKVVDGVRNFLFGPPGAGGLDLVSLNIERGRDHGLADYNSVRETYGLKRVTRFDQITSDPELQAQLQDLYGSVDNIDLWVGGLAEDHVQGGSVGATFRAIISDQFERLRDGDRFWYQTQFSGKTLQQIERTTLRDVIARNTKLTTLQKNVFAFHAGISGTVLSASSSYQRGPARPRPGVIVELVDTGSGDVVATTRTNGRGQYEFDVGDGLRTGVYKVQANLGGNSATVTSRQIAIRGGDQFVKGVNLTLRLNDPGPSPRPKSRDNGPRPNGQLAAAGAGSAGTAAGSSKNAAHPTAKSTTAPLASDNGDLDTLRNQLATLARRQQQQQLRALGTALSGSELQRLLEALK